ncbi:MAG: M48 family metalloprotease [Vicinamibacterales bacterium]
MNEPKSSRYHRLKRRAGFAAGCGTVLLLAGLLWLRPSLPLTLYVVMLVALHELIALPVAFYRSFVLERRYELSTETARAWLRDHLKAVGITLAFALVAAHVVYALIAWSPVYWWLPAAAAATAATVLLTTLAPVLLFPLFYTFTPLDRPQLTGRLVALSTRAGVPVLGVYAWGLGAKTRRANAALVGSGATRRILLSDTLLAEYSDDEIEVILAHEIAHHVHHDIRNGILLEFGLLLAASCAASAALLAWWHPLGLSGPADPAGMPLLLLAGGAVTLAAAPLVHAFSRANERRADRFALALTGLREPFVSAMRRLGAQNLIEEEPSRLTVWLFHTHPPIEQRVAAARTM